MRLPGHKHEVLGLLSARDFKTPQFSPDSSRPRLLFADARPTLPQIKSSCNATGDAGQVGRDPLGEQGHQPRAQGQTGPSSPHQPPSWGRGKPGPRGAELLSAHPLAGVLIAFHPPPEAAANFNRSQRRWGICLQLSSWPRAPSRGLGHLLPSGNVSWPRDTGTWRTRDSFQVGRSHKNSSAD